MDDPDDTKQNKNEARAVIEELTRMIENGDLNGDREGEQLTVGILSPFRMQASLLQNLVYEKFNGNPRIISDFGITVSTVDGFQGDEKDIIVYSLRYAANSKPGTINAIQRAGDEHALGRLNVAFSRARRKVIVFISVPKETFPKGLIREFLDHVANIQNSHYHRFGNPNEREKCQSDFKRDIFDRLVKRGLTVYSQVPCGGFYIDFVVFDDKGRRIALECDGEFHYDGADLREEDYQRQDIIERYGWAVYRISSRNYYANPETGINKIIDFLMSQTPDVEVVMEKMDVEKEVFVAEKIEAKPEEDQEAMKEGLEEPEYEERKETTERESFQPIEREREEEEIRVELTESEKDILDVLSVHGDLRVYEISMKTDFPREEVIDILNVLLEKGFVECYFENRVKVWHRIDYDIKRSEEQSANLKVNNRNIFVDSKMWFELAKWGRETGKLNKDLINFASKAGERIKKNWEISAFNKTKMTDLWKMVTAQGFIPRRHSFYS